MKFENTMVYNIDRAMIGMRNPKNSWDKNDTILYVDDTWTGKEVGQHLGNGLCVYIGPNDMKLAKSLIKAGNEHRKFLRQIFVSVDITAPFYFYKEFDTYKVATTANSCSTMHKITSEPITLNSFEITDYNPDLILYDKEPYDIDTTVGDGVESIINMCETLRKRYLETKDERYWKELIRWLPEGWLQKRTWTGSYETIRSMYHQRDHHKLRAEWVDGFCRWAESLPYAQEFIIE